MKKVYSSLKIHNFIDQINSIYFKRRFSYSERLAIFKIAKISKDLEDFKENIKWEFYF
tara:strand:- start:372 stop:545 length:174 start_codon:yes stop_codon:yes gene_type:complete